MQIPTYNFCSVSIGFSYVVKLGNLLIQKGGHATYYQWFLKSDSGSSVWSKNHECLQQICCLHWVLELVFNPLKLSQGNRVRQRGYLWSLLRLAGGDEEKDFFQVWSVLNKTCFQMKILVIAVLRQAAHNGLWLCEISDWFTTWAEQEFWFWRLIRLEEQVPFVPTAF